MKNKLNTVNIIEKLCNNRDISKSELEKKLNFSNALISKWSESYPKADKIVAIAQYFNVSSDYLLGLTKNPTPVDQILSDEYINILQRLIFHMSTRDKKKMMDIIRVHFMEDFEEVDSEQVNYSQTTLKL
ncbi:MAG: helix-turn-helix domain-containing protein [Oscillospiraceae bacterium]|nr:helix-turn-helix domain-containing protein [Oscillospiraceae bacterium]